MSGSQHARLRMHDLRNKPPSTVEWLDGEHPRRILSEDGYDLVYHIPSAIKEKSRVRLVFHTRSLFPELCIDHSYGSPRGIQKFHQSSTHH